MTERKQVARHMAKAANEKPKALFKILESNFEEGARASVAAKVLLYSRLIVIDKIAEVIGGKD